MGHNDIRFSSDDIRRPVQDTRSSSSSMRVRTGFWHRVADFLFYDFHKFISIPILIALVAGLVLFILSLTVWRSQPVPDRQEEISQIATELSQTSSDWAGENYLTMIEVGNIIRQGQENSFSDAVAYLNQAIDNTTNQAQLFDLLISRANLYGSEALDFQTYLKYLQEIDESTLDREQLVRLYSNYNYVYKQLGDEATAQAYEDKMFAVYDNVVTEEWYDGIDLHQEDK